MTPRQFTVLAVATAATLVLAAIVNASSDQWASGTAGGAKLFPTLKNDLKTARTLTIKKGDKTLVLERKSDTEWLAKSSSGYPAQGEKIRALTTRLADAELVAAKTRMAERFALLELENPGKDAKSRLVTLADDKGKVLAEAIIGKRSVEQFGAGKGGTYVRRPGQNETWLINTEIDPSTDVNQWVETTIFEADIAKVKRVAIQMPGETPITIDREKGKPPGKDAYKLADMPAGKVLKTDFALADIINAFARIELEDVRKQALAGSVPAKSAGPVGGPQTATFETENGLKIVLDVRSEGDQRWARVEASGSGDTEAPADKINTQAAGWEFRLPSWKYEQIFKKRADLLKDVAPAAAKGGAGAAGAGPGAGPGK